MEYYDSLKPIFALDPLLLPNFIQCCPPEGYHSLFEVIEPSIALSRIALVLTNSDYLYTDKVVTLLSLRFFSCVVLNR